MPLFVDNRATVGNSYMILVGVVTYELPVPPGHWLQNGHCQVYREGCPMLTQGPYLPPSVEPECLARFGSCALQPDIVTDQGVVPPFVGSKQCTESTKVQPCDWFTSSELLGRQMYM